MKPHRPDTTVFVKFNLNLDIVKLTYTKTACSSIQKPKAESFSIIRHDVQASTVLFSLKMSTTTFEYT